MDKKKDIEALLELRTFVPSRDDLTDRIVSATQSLTQKNGETLFDWLQELFTALPIPKPYYVLTFILALGFIVGLTAPLAERETGIESAEKIYIQEFLYVPEREL